MKNVLLTGAGPRGFIGRNIAPALKEKYNLFTPGSKELDLCDYERVERYIEENRIDAVVHGAAQSQIHTGMGDILQHDLQMFYHLDKISEKLEKVLFFGSGAAFDKRFPEDMITEDEIGRSVPAEYYGLSKYIMAVHAKHSEKMYDLRLFGVYGPHEYWQTKFISNLCCKAMYDLPLSIRQNCMFDYLFIEDLPQIVCWFLEHEPKYHDYNVCTGMPVDLLTIAHLVNQVSGKDLPITVLKEGWNNSYTASPERLFSEMGEVKLTTIEDGIRKLYRFYCEHKDEIPYDVLKETR